MNYDANEIKWRIGDIVIHDADAKNEKMLMKVIEILPEHKRKTIYINQKSAQKSYINRCEVLHDPRRFNIDHIKQPDCDIMSETLKRDLM